MEGILQEETVLVALHPVCEFLVVPQLPSVSFLQIRLKRDILSNSGRPDKSVVCKERIN